MKKIFLFIISLLLITACTKKEVKFEAFSGEAFAYDLGDGVAEVNASLRVKGFLQTKSDNIYNASISFTVDVIKPDNQVVKSLFSYVAGDMKKEPIDEMVLQAQFNLDSSFPNGKYILVYNITDNNSKQQLQSKIEVDVEK